MFRLSCSAPPTGRVARRASVGTESINTGASWRWDTSSEFSFAQDGHGRMALKFFVSRDPDNWDNINKIQSVLILE